MSFGKIKVREPFLFEDWPLLYTLFYTSKKIFGAWKSHYWWIWTGKMIVGFGPKPSFYLRLKSILDLYEDRKNNMFGRFKNLTWNAQPYKNGSF